MMAGTSFTFLYDAEGVPYISFTQETSDLEEDECSALRPAIGPYSETEAMVPDSITDMNELNSRQPSFGSRRWTLPQRDWTRTTAARVQRTKSTPMANRQTEVPNPRSTQLRSDDVVSQRSGVGDGIDVSEASGNRTNNRPAETGDVPGTTGGAGADGGVGGAVGTGRGSGNLHREAEAQAIDGRDRTCI